MKVYRALSSKSKDLDKRLGTGFLLKIKPITLASMKSKLGIPSIEGSIDGKVKYEWVVKIGNQYLTVYDYKGDKWHIGGRLKDKKKAISLMKYLEEK